MLTTHPYLSAEVWKGRAIPLLTLACYRENLLQYPGCYISWSASIFQSLYAQSVTVNKYRLCSSITWYVILVITSKWKLNIWICFCKHFVPLSWRHLPVGRRRQLLFVISQVQFGAVTRMHSATSSCSQPMNHNQFPSNPVEITHHSHYVGMRTICLFNKTIDCTENVIWSINHVFREHRKAILYVQGGPLLAQFITAHPTPAPIPINIKTSNGKKKEMFCFITYRSVNSFLSCLVYFFIYFVYLSPHWNGILRNDLHTAILGVLLEVWIEWNALNYWGFTRFCNNMISELLQSPYS